MTPSYAGQNIWIIGASSGIGRALAIELAKSGATLILSARRAEELEALHATLDRAHHIFPFDVADSDAVMCMANRIRACISQLDRVIFMAAMYDPAPLAQLDLKAAHAALAINLGGALHIVHAVLPIFRSQGYGQLALCGSVAGYRGLPNGQPYSATKAAIINLAESLRAEERTFDIKIINPGFVRTALTDKNTFKMPMRIEPEEAARIIARELQTACFEIHFPKRFTFLMKMIALLPSWIYFRCLSRF